jgi:hypothetical protein
MSSTKTQSVKKYNVTFLEQLNDIAKKVSPTTRAFIVKFIKWSETELYKLDEKTADSELKFWDKKLVEQMRQDSIKNELLNLKYLVRGFRIYKFQCYMQKRLIKGNRNADYEKINTEMSNFQEKKFVAWLSSMEKILTPSSIVLMHKYQAILANDFKKPWSERMTGKELKRWYNGLMLSLKDEINPQRFSLYEKFKFKIMRRNATLL